MLCKCCISTTELSSVRPPDVGWSDNTPLFWATGACVHGVSTVDTAPM